MRLVLQKLRTVSGLWSPFQMVTSLPKKLLQKIWSGYLVLKKRFSCLTWTDPVRKQLKKWLNYSHQDDVRLPDWERRMPTCYLQKKEDQR